MKGNKLNDQVEGRLVEVLSILRRLRVGLLSDEYQIHVLIEELLVENEIPFQKEYKLAPGNRIDFFVENGIGIEVKRGKPNRSMVTKQLTRYASFDDIQAIILVVERNVLVPDVVMGKKCILFGLNRLWGVALG